MSSSPNDTSRPIEPDEARATTSSTGKLRSARVLRISRPTLPVAPTTATLKPISGTPGLECELGPGWLLTYDAGRRFTSRRRPGRAVRSDEIRRILAALPRRPCRSPHSRLALSRHLGRLGLHCGRCRGGRLALARGGV